VETEAQLEFLRKHECDEAQGYYFSRPLEVQEAAHYLSSGRKAASAASSL